MLDPPSCSPAPPATLAWPSTSGSRPSACSSGGRGGVCCGLARRCGPSCCTGSLHGGPAALARHARCAGLPVEQPPPQLCPARTRCRQACKAHDAHQARRVLGWLASATRPALPVRCRCGNLPGAHPRLRPLLAPSRYEHGDVVLMCLSTLQIAYSWMILPQARAGGEAHRQGRAACFAQGSAQGFAACAACSASEGRRGWVRLAPSGPGGWRCLPCLTQQRGVPSSRVWKLGRQLHGSSGNYRDIEGCSVYGVRKEGGSLQRQGDIVWGPRSRGAM